MNFIKQSEPLQEQKKNLSSILRRELLNGEYQQSNNTWSKPSSTGASFNPQS
jgi:hypothetical protein